MAAIELEDDAEDYSFLPSIHDILKSMDKDSQDVHQELIKLKTKIQEAREQILAMPGIESTPDEQQQQLRTLREQVRTKNQLLHKYKGLCMFDIPKS
ncbi:mediator of RNA polymerase II transcription subunit 9 [Denticeps clupeoides]|uniref:Mediator of RNA polymerase II transcription subunit 9 n=1 Tax=Denticeps clupeoides TaxID=299321 RepID=A0AAY4DDU0_9TELE|nr:mediator of RNA polymerase II transcription subunit 9 [Denticeps clupeoides]